MYILIFVITLALSLALTPVMKKISIKYKVFDRPEDSLKIHRKPVAYLGGLAIFLAFLMGMLMAARYWIPGSIYRIVVGIIGGGGIVFALGLLDDWRGFKVSYRFLGQILAALILILVGVKLGFIPLLAVSVPLTIFYVVGACNALNLLDGLDGLAGGVAAICSLGFLILGGISGNLLVMILALALMGSILGFLPYNFHPASIFMGDAGSGFLGFILATLAVLCTSRPYNLAWFLAPLLILGIPIFDTAVAIGRRALNRRPLFSGDRSHFYDLMMKKGISHRNTVLIIYGIGFLLMALGVGIVIILD